MTTMAWNVTTPVGPMAYTPADPALDVHPELGIRLAWQPNEEGCFEAAAATILGVDFAEVPTMGDDHSPAAVREAWARFESWLSGRGYRMRRGPVTREVLNRYWLGVSLDPRPGWDHVVVCLCRRVVHDVALRFGASLPAGLGIAPITQLEEAITFDRLETP